MLVVHVNILVHLHGHWQFGSRCRGCRLIDATRRADATVHGRIAAKCGGHWVFRPLGDRCRGDVLVHEVATLR